MVGGEDGPETRLIGLFTSLGDHRHPWRDELGHLAEVLGGCGEEELVMSAVWAT